MFICQYGITSLKPESSFGRNAHRWDDNVNVVLEGVWLESVYWIYLLKIWSTYRLLCKRCWTFGLLKKCQNVLTSWSDVTFWRRVLPFGVVLKYYVALVWIVTLLRSKFSDLRHLSEQLCQRREDGRLCGQYGFNWGLWSVYHGVIHCTVFVVCLVYRQTPT
jgi:hypothetical protein